MEVKLPLMFLTVPYIRIRQKNPWNPVTMMNNHRLS